MADFAKRSPGIDYTGGSALLPGCVLASLFAWYSTLGSISVDTVREPKAELFYWLTITFSQGLGVSRCVIRYRSSRPDDGPLPQRFRELAAERRQFGYRCLGYLLARKCMTPNHKKLLGYIAKRPCGSFVGGT